MTCRAEQLRRALIDRADDLALDVACLADELRDEIDHGGVPSDVWRAVATLRKVRFVAPVQRGQQAAARAMSA